MPGSNSGRNRCLSRFPSGSYSPPTGSSITPGLHNARTPSALLIMGADCATISTEIPGRCAPNRHLRDTGFQHFVGRHFGEHHLELKHQLLRICPICRHSFRMRHCEWRTRHLTQCLAADLGRLGKVKSKEEHLRLLDKGEYFFQK